MADQLTVDGKEFISSKRASELSGYAQDYIGQLARGGLIEARRIGGLWFVFMDSLQGYKTKAEEYKPQPPQHQQSSDPETLINFDGKDYVSAARASKLTGYHQDYVGQLARSGTILSRQVGNRWYVEKEGLLSHKNEKDALLGAVQAESVGIVRKEPPEVLERAPEPIAEVEESQVTYTQDDADLIPVFNSREEMEIREWSPPVIHSPSQHTQKVFDHSVHVKHVKSQDRKGKKTMFYGAGAFVAVITVIVVSLGFFIARSPITASAANNSRGSRFMTVAATAFDYAGRGLEVILVHELVYKRFN